MARAERLLERVTVANASVSFRDLQYLLAQLGFELQRVSGSHHIYTHPRVTRPLSIQPRGGEAKPYQVRQLRDMIEEFGLSLDRR